MNLKALLEKQKELDEVIFKNSGIEEYPYINMKVALLVELGELSNEVQSFKHWKKNKNVDKERVLDEFADCLHFALSLEGELNQTSDTILNDSSVFIEAYEDAVRGLGDKLEDRYINNAILSSYERISEGTNFLITIISLGLCLGITLDEMEQAYLKKHEVNYKRQVDGY